MVEIVVGVAVLSRYTRYAAYVVMIWMWYIAADLVSQGAFFDIAVREISLEAFALAKLQEQLKHGQVNLDDPAVTIGLLKLNAVVSMTGYTNSQGGLDSVGIQCALCHSTVNDSLAPGIGEC